MKFDPSKVKPVTSKQALRAALRLRRALAAHKRKTDKLHVGQY